MTSYDKLERNGLLRQKITNNYPQTCNFFMYIFNYASEVFIV